VGENILLVGAAYVAVATTGLMTSLLVRKTRVARPGLAFAWSDLAVSGETVRMFWRDRPLLAALTMYSVFWLIGGLTLPAVNAFGKLQLFRDLDIKAADDNTSLLAGFLTIGIAAGCALAGWISGKKIDFRLVPWGCWGMVVGLGALSLLGWLGTAGNESTAPYVSQGVVNLGSKVLLVVMGIAAGV